MEIDPGIEIVYLGSGVAHTVTQKTLDAALVRRGGRVTRPTFGQLPTSEWGAMLGWLLWLPIELRLTEGVEGVRRFDLRLTRWRHMQESGDGCCDSIQLVPRVKLLLPAPYFTVIYTPEEGAPVETAGLVTVDFGDLGLWFQVVPYKQCPQAAVNLPPPAGWKKHFQQVQPA